MSNGQKVQKKWIILPIVGVLIVTLFAGAGFLFGQYRKADNAISSIKRDSSLLPPSAQNANQVVDPSPGKQIVYLLLGSDTRGSTDAGRSDTMLLAVISADRKNIYLISIPRDIYVDIPGHGKNKINAAYQLGGAALTTQTVENLFDVTVNHVALVDFNSFINMIDQLGGVTIDNPWQACDTSQHICWNKGKVTLTNAQALHYVRWRHGLPNGDITRNQNQQRVLKAIFAKLMSEGSLMNINKLTDLLNQISKDITVDSSLSNSEIKSTALNLKLGSSNDIRSIITPIDSYESIPSIGDVDILNEAYLQELQSALNNNTLDQYFAKHKDDPVAGAATVK